MENREIPHTTPIPGVIKAIGDGCSLAANKAYLLIPPVLLDLFLLFGPKLRIEKYLMPVIESMLNRTMASSANIGARQIELLGDMLSQSLSSVNLFGFLRTIPIGIGVIFTSSSNSTPLGTAAAAQMTSTLVILLLMVLFSICGVLLGTIYYSIIAAAASNGQKFSWKGLGTQLLNVILLYIVMIIMGVMLAIPISCLLTVTFMVIPILYQFLMLALIVLACWIMIPLFFIPQGIFMKGLDFPNAVKESFKMASWSSTITIRFVLLSLVLSFGLDMIWTIPEQSSWLVLFSIFGHAYVSTALLASSFILFRELDQWQKDNRSFLEWRKANLRIRQIFKKETETHD